LTWQPRALQGQRKGGTHQGKVAERLWEVPELAPVFSVVFLVEQSKIIPGGCSSLEQSTGISSLPIIL